VEKGSYTGRRGDFKKYAASLFNPYLFADLKSHYGCGATALALLTGVHPSHIARKNGGADYPDQFVVRFLRARGFSVLPLTWCRVSEAKSPVGPTHVILLSQLFRENEATWGVIFNCFYYHNFEIYSLETLSLLNKPVLTAYLVSTPRWKSGPAAVSRPKRRAPVGKMSYYFADLRIPRQRVAPGSAGSSSLCA
jgi:hypothetical protein